MRILGWIGSAGIKQPHFDRKGLFKVFFFPRYFSELQKQGQVFSIYEHKYRMTLFLVSQSRRRNAACGAVDFPGAGLSLTDFVRSIIQTIYV